MSNRQAEVTAAQKDIDFDKFTYQVVFETNMGNITLDLWPEVAPGHCKNLIGLAKIGYYDGVTFHRVIKNFMIQGGCPQGTGTGGPGYTIKAEFNKQRHVPGVLSMARTSDPNSAGSQFFLCAADCDFLNNQYTGFGKAADKASLDVIMNISVVPTNSSDKPLKPVTINKATVSAKAK